MQTAVCIKVLIKYCVSFFRQRHKVQSFNLFHISHTDDISDTEMESDLDINISVAK